MYEGFFGLERRPFAATPNPDCCAAVETMQTAFDELHRCVDEGRGIAIVSAPPGTGKTLLCRTLVDDLQDAYAVAFLADSGLRTKPDLLQAILFELGQPYQQMSEQELRLQLRAAITTAANECQGLLLIIDEAHLLSDELLEETRIITNLASGGRPMVRLVLSGNLSLDEHLTSPALTALNQRIGSHVTLETFSRAESIDYIEFCLRWAGGELRDVFTSDAVDLIVQACDGLPRCLNQLCDHSLLLGFAAEQHPVERGTVREALDDVKRLPLQWNIPLCADSDDDFDAGSSETDSVVSSIADKESIQLESDAAEHDSPSPSQPDRLETGQSTYEVGVDSDEELFATGTGPGDQVIEEPDTNWIEIGEQGIEFGGDVEIVEIGECRSPSDGDTSATIDGAGQSIDREESIDHEPIDTLADAQVPEAEVNIIAFQDGLGGDDQIGGLECDYSETAPGDSLVHKASNATSPPENTQRSEVVEIVELRGGESFSEDVGLCIPDDQWESVELRAWPQVVRYASVRAAWRESVWVDVESFRRSLCVVHLDFVHHDHAGPADEAVVDRYAVLDANNAQTGFVSPSIVEWSTDLQSLPAGFMQEAAPLLVDSSSGPASAELTRANVTLDPLSPDQSLEVVLPLIDLVLETDRSSNESTVLEDFPVWQAIAHQTWNPADADLEGTSVIEAGLSSREAIANADSVFVQSTTDGTPNPSAISPEMDMFVDADEDAEPGFDIVRPENVEEFDTIPIQRAASATSNSAPRESESVQPNALDESYARLFTRLRRRLG